MRELMLVATCSSLMCLSAVTVVGAAPSSTTEASAADSAASHSGNLQVRERRTVEYAAASGRLKSSLVSEADGEGGRRLTGVTRLSDGTRLREEARFDRTDRLVHAQSIRSCPSGQGETVTLDARSGVVEVRAAEGSRRWSVPTDLPWIWVARGCSTATALATPVSVLVALSGAPRVGARRLVDPGRPVSHSIMIDQVVVPEDERSFWVVLGDEAVLVRDGLPQRWRSSALGEDVELLQPLR